MMAAPEPSMTGVAAAAGAIGGALTAFAGGLMLVWKAGGRSATIEADIAELKARSESQSEQIGALTAKGDARHEDNQAANHALDLKIAGLPTREDLRQSEDRIIKAVIGRRTRAPLD
jgi:hypothetical protein